MDKRVGAIATSIALMVLCTSTGAHAQSPVTPQQTEQGGGMGQGGMMGRGMMRGVMAQE